MPTTTPVLLAPANLTKHLKVFLDSAGWRDKTKLIARYTHIIGAAQPQSPLDHDTLTLHGFDLTLYMAMALLSLDELSATITHGSRMSLFQLLQDPSSSLSSLEWPASLSDPSIQKSIFITCLDPSMFTTPKHLLVQTPLEKLHQNITEFLTPFLQSWAASDDSNEGIHDQDRLSLESLPELIASIPQKWEHYSAFTLLPSTAFLTLPWPAVLSRLQALDQAQRLGQREQGQDDTIMIRWERLIQEALQSTHIARKAIIPVQDVLRRPQIRPLTGDWKLHNQYKTWVELQETSFLEHQDVASPNTTTTTHKDIISSNTTRLESEADLTCPTPANFSRAYWSTTCQNQVHYVWSPMFTMFSAGNITEKERVANSRPIFDARDKVVVDLYAGIGYFSLVYLVHAGAKVVHASEWNPWSVEGIIRGAERNEISWKVYKGPALASTSSETGPRDQQQQQQQTFEEREVPLRTGPGKKPKNYGQLIVYPGDNAQWIRFFENTAHHVNLGLIPSAEPGWVLGVRALCPSEGGYLHVHHNIRIGEEETFKSYLLQSLRDLFATWKQGGNSEGSSDGTCTAPPTVAWSIDIRHMENVKSFAPMVFHYVVDVECRPPSSDRFSFAPGSAT